MSNVRLIARLDVKAPDLIKGVHLEGWRKLGNPREFAERYYREGIDELLYIDAVASLYRRNTIIDLVRATAENVFIPITVGGGIRSIDDAHGLLRAGADKVAVNTAALQRPELIGELAGRFGSQCIVLSIQAKRDSNGSWEALCDLGREHSGRDAVEWAAQGAELGAGEVLVTSIDREGTRRGFDADLTKAISGAVRIPTIASGGMGLFEHVYSATAENGADAVAMAHVLHYGETTVPALRAEALAAGLGVRPVDISD